MNRFLQNLSLLLFRLTLGCLVLLFAAKELAKQWTLIQPVITHYQIPGSDWTYVVAGILLFMLGLGLILGFYTRIMALLLFLALAAGSTFYKPVDAGVTFQLISLYGVILLGLLISGGGRWAIKRTAVTSAKTSVLDSEQSLISSQRDAKSIFDKEEDKATPSSKDGTTILMPPQHKEAKLTEDPVAELETSDETTEEEDYLNEDDTELGSDEKR